MTIEGSFKHDQSGKRTSVLERMHQKRKSRKKKVVESCKFQRGNFLHFLHCSQLLWLLLLASVPVLFPTRVILRLAGLARCGMSGAIAHQRPRKETSTCCFSSILSRLNVLH
jgi:hypothetical protein